MSKIAETNEKISKKVTEGYKKIENGVVEGYKKIETGVVEGFEKVSDKCVEVLFAKEGESVEEAKNRLNGNNKYREVIIMNRNDQQFMAQKIRTQYMEKEATELDALRQLDKKVKRPVNVFSYVFGSISAIVMGAGMSLVMTDISSQLGLGDMMIPGIIIGVVGMILAIINYPIHKGMMNSRKKKYANEIIRLSEKIMNNK